MAKSASPNVVQADMRPPNFRAAVQMVRTIKPKKDRISGINGEIADAFAKIEGMKVNRKAARIFAALDNMEHVERADVMRSLNGLIDASEWEKQLEDLADQAEGKVVPMRVGGDVDADLSEALGEQQERDDIEEVEDEFEASEEELAKQKPRKDAAAKADLAKELPSGKA